MRILHTSDWHLGRSFHRVGMLDAQAAYVDHLVEVVRSERVDTVLVAGDVYDRALPAVDVVALLDEALGRLVGAGATVVLSSGNHDSARRLGFASRLLEAAKVHVRTRVGRVGEPVLLDDAHGPVAIYPFPYLEPAIAAPVLGCAPGHQGVLAAAMSAVRADLAGRPGGTRSVVAAHLFVVGGEVSESERDISVGGVAAVPAKLFAGVDYVALGHLHGRQQITERVRYSGSPLAYSFSEHRQRKGSWLVTLGRSGVETIEAVDAPVPRPLALLRGRLPDLLRDSALAAHEQAWCQVTLTDAERPAEAMQRVRSRFPHALELRFEPQGGGVALARSSPTQVRGRDDVEVCCEFLEHVRGRGPSSVEVDWLRAALVAHRMGEAEERGVAAIRAARRDGEPAPLPVELPTVVPVRGRQAPIERVVASSPAPDEARPHGSRRAVTASAASPTSTQEELPFELPPTRLRSVDLLEDVG